MALMSILQYQILEHIGYCTVNGFRIPIPYLIKDLGDMIASPFPLSLPKDYTLPGSINMDFNSEEDIDVLGCLPGDYSYWWKVRVPCSDESPAVAGPSAAMVPRVTRHIIDAHFADYCDLVCTQFSRIPQLTKIKCKMFPKTREILIKDGPLYDPVKPEVPGLAPRPPPPIPRVSVSPAGSDRPAPSTCHNCAALQKTLVLAFDQLWAAQTHVKAAVIVGREAVERSNARSGGYDALYRINRDHGMPFEHGDRLPKEYLKKHPRHERNDPSQEAKGKARENPPQPDRGRRAPGRGIPGYNQEDPDAEKEAKEAKGKARENPPQPDHGRSPPPEAGRGIAPELRSSGSRASMISGDESEESIPPGHSVSASEGSDDEDLLAIYDGDSEKDGNWEMDPNTEGECENE